MAVKAGPAIGNRNNIVGLLTAVYRHPDEAAAGGNRRLP
jgi:hypothetical protein